MLFRLLLAVACLHHASCILTPNPYFWQKRVCHDEMLPEFRCYDREFPYNNSNGYLPESPATQNINFKLFTQNSRTTPYILGARNTNSVKSSNFVKNGKVAFVIHGFTDNSDEPWVASLVKELLVQVPNVIAVDWKYGARGPHALYTRATANTRVVGAQIATLIKTMISANVGVTLDNIHLIGHSLGAQIAGYAGEKFKTTQIGRITGLDPAAPNFEGFDIRVRLDPTDAAFVDVIHTSFYGLLYGGLGFSTDCGHVDFWPNYWRDMPGCPDTSRYPVLPKNFRAGSCNHAMAYKYFTASINDNCFESYICTNPTPREHRSWRNNMGYHACPDRPGRYCLSTGTTYPFTYRRG